jgi:penicillin amidase
MKAIKWTLITFTVIITMFVLITYVVIRASLPSLDGNISSASLKGQATLSRDIIGTAIINAESEHDAAYVLGYAHAQDRLFQLDLLRRQSAGELSEIVGARALELDKKHRFHQFRQRAKNIFESLSEPEQQILTQYTKGVNAGASSLSFKPFEYILTSSEFAPWRPEDSLLASYSMYIDLQLTQTEIDFRLTALKTIFGADMHQFFTPVSTYQAAIDASVTPVVPIKIPQLPHANITDGNNQTAYYFDSIVEQADYGSNNWAVSGQLTDTQSAMLSNDMHLGLRIPAIWYRTQINYKSHQQNVTVTGVSLPGTPAVTVGSNGHIAWGFTNSNVDNVDWIKLNDDTPTTTVVEEIITPNDIVSYTFEMSKYGPVRTLNGQRYALKWVAHQNYAVNILIGNMAKTKTIEEALKLSTTIRIPVQNMVVADSAGKVAFQLTGAMSKRAPLARHAITEAQYSDDWDNAQFSPANHINPESGRVWTANARVIGTNDLAQFGDGGYALGARQHQIASLLMQQDSFDEADFYDIQLNNQATFLKPWHKLLLESLANKPQEYASDIAILNEWGACACADSVGYTLVRRFRSTVINQLLAPINDRLKVYNLSTSYIAKSIEPSIWALLQQQPLDWLPNGHADYSAFVEAAYRDTKQRLFTQYNVRSTDLSELRWGNVNALAVKHPFSNTLGRFSELVDMKVVEGFGDSYVPAVQSNSFGASQRLIVKPGNEENAILTIPGGQSGHFLSSFYRTGFDDYAAQANTPLLPLEQKHKIVFTPK